jgi:hypothetical protein
MKTGPHTFFLRRTDSTFALSIELMKSFVGSKSGGHMCIASAVDRTTGHGAHIGPFRSRQEAEEWLSAQGWHQRELEIWEKGGHELRLYDLVSPDDADSAL